MIVDKFMQILNGIVTGLLGLFPQWDVGIPGLSDAGDALGSALSYGNRFFPVTTLGICLGLIIGARLALFAWTAAKWVYSVIPFKMT